MPRGRLLLVLLVTVGLLALAGAGTVLFAYDRATEVNRSTPTIAVHQFLTAVFVDRDEGRVDLFTCREWTSERSAEARGQFDPEVTVKWQDVAEVSRQGNQAVVTARLQLLLSGYVNYQQWRFQVVDDHGWRVCAAAPA